MSTRQFAGLLVLLAVRAIAALWLAQLLTCEAPAAPAGVISTRTGDAASYLEPIENWLREGTYYWNNGERRVYAGRLPYYGLFHLLFRFAFPAALAHEALALFQILVSCFADNVLARTCQSLFRTPRAYWIALAFLAANLLPVHNAMSLSPESLAMSLLTVVLCYSLQPPKTLLGKLAYGAGLALLGALRPYLFPIAAFALMLSIARRDLKQALLVGLPVAALLLPWTVRNWFVLGRLVPLQEDPYAGYAGYDATYLAYRSWMGAWGGNSQYWDRRSVGCYFEPHNVFPCDVSAPPPESLAGNYSRQQLEDARRALSLSRQDPAAAAKARAEFAAFAADLKASAPLTYWVLAPLRLLREALFHSGSYWMPVALSGRCATKLSTVIKLQQSLLYHSLLLAGGCSLLLLALRGGAPLLWLFVPASLIVVFCVIFRLPEFRYFNALQPVFYLAVFRAVSELRGDTAPGVRM